MECAVQPNVLSLMVVVAGRALKQQHAVGRPGRLSVWPSRGRLRLYRHACEQQVGRAGVRCMLGPTLKVQIPDTHGRLLHVVFLFVEWGQATNHSPIHPRRVCLLLSARGLDAARMGEA
jgi:hypothetical protein